MEVESSGGRECGRFIPEGYLPVKHNHSPLTERERKCGWGLREEKLKKERVTERERERESAAAIVRYFISHLHTVHVDIPVRLGFHANHSRVLCVSVCMPTCV
jgi:hypothetical protein